MKLSHRHRQILDALGERPHTTNGLVSDLGLSPSATRSRLRYLRTHGYVERERVLDGEPGKSYRYHLAGDGDDEGPTDGAVSAACLGRGDDG